MSKPRVLLVCTGNSVPEITTEETFSHLAPSRYDVQSAGTSWTTLNAEG